MAITATSTQKEFELLPAGNYVARCVSMIDIGTQTKEYADTIKQVHEVMIGFELPTELMESGKPFMVSRKFTLSLHEKSNLRKVLESWRGKGFTDTEIKKFDISQLLGKTCMVNVIHNTKDERTYANISSISPVPKGMPIPAQVNPSFEFSFENFSNEVFGLLPSWIQDKIKTTPEYVATTLKKEDAVDLEERIPNVPADEPHDNGLPF